MMRMPMVNMGKTPEDVKKEIGDLYPSAPAASTTSAYPYGLCLSFDDEVMKKLGMVGDMPTVGDIMQFCAIAKVTSASQNEREKTDGSKEVCCRVELQITDMGMIGAEPAPRAAKWYGGEPDGDEG